LGPTEANLKATAQAMISACNSWDIANILPSTWRSPSCIHQILPVSLSRPPMSNVQYEEFFSSIIPGLRNFCVSINDEIGVLVDARERKICMWAKGEAETDVGEYKNEYVFMLKVDEDGKVIWIGEFVDSWNSVVFVPKL
ncbi:hypothetical protein K435DRAFT_638482, partial [Dendrothele bispora CBS 962.96]